MTTRCTMKSLAAAAMALAVLVAGCRGADKPAGDQASTGRSAGLRIAMIAKSSTNPVFLSARTGAHAYALFVDDPCSTNGEDRR